MKTEVQFLNIDGVAITCVNNVYILYVFIVIFFPQAVVRPSGGHAVNLMWTMPHVYGMQRNDVWWAASDLGWVVGHSYICYAPLLYGITSILFEVPSDSFSTFSRRLFIFNSSLMMIFNRANLSALQIREPIFGFLVNTV